MCEHALMSKSSTALCSSGSQQHRLMNSGQWPMGGMRQCRVPTTGNAMHPGSARALHTEQLVNQDVCSLAHAPHGACAGASA